MLNRNMHNINTCTHDNIHSDRAKNDFAITYDILLLINNTVPNIKKQCNT